MNDKLSTASAAADLARVAEELRAATAQMTDAFTGQKTVVRDLRMDCDPQRPGRSLRWEYTVRMPASADPADVVARQVIPALQAAGWRTTDRSSDREIAYQFSRDGFYLGVNFNRDGTGDIVFGGSSRCVPA